MTFYHSTTKLQVMVLFGSHHGAKPKSNRLEWINLEDRTTCTIKTPMTMFSDWDTDGCGICFVPDFNVKQYGFNGLNPLVGSLSDNKFHAIFKCGGLEAASSHLRFSRKASLILFE